MKLFCFLIIMSFGFVNSTYAAELVLGSGLAKAVDEGKAPLGFTKAIPCAENYELQTGCYEWTPADSELSGHCYRAKLIGLQNNFPESAQLQIDSSRDEYVVMVNYHSRPIKESRLESVKINENANYAVVYGFKIDCAPSSRNNPLIFEEITSSIPLVVPASFNLQENFRSDCLLAEKIIRNGGGKIHLADDRQFYCLETETHAEADIIVEFFLEDLKHRGSEIKNDPHGPLSNQLFQNTEWFTVPTIYSQGMSTGNFSAGLRVTTLSPEELASFYAETGIDVEITPDHAVVLFGFNVNFLKK